MKEYRLLKGVVAEVEENYAVGWIAELDRDEGAVVWEALSVRDAEVVGLADRRFSVESAVQSTLNVPIAAMAVQPMTGAIVALRPL